MPSPPPCRPAATASAATRASAAIATIPDQRGAFTGIDARTLTPGHLARALLEGVAETFHTLYGTMQGAGVAPRTRLIGSGNGLRQNPLLTAIVAERFGLPLIRPAHREEAAFGAALLAATATGELTLSEATSRIRYETV